MYKKLYKEIIDNAKAEDRVKSSDNYYEKHHIVPDFLFKNRKRKGPSGHLDGDPNSNDNIVMLTFKEHLMAHYYLYEIYKGTRYEYSAGSALQFFFVKAVGGHSRQVHLTEVDEEFLKKMEHLRKIGNDSISKARKGTMPVVDAKTRESIGSVSINHPRVLSGEWIHHSKGVPSRIRPENRRSMKGSNNVNFKELTDDRKIRIWECVKRSCVEDYMIVKLFVLELKKEFTEFKKISHMWVLNNYENYQNLINEVNSNCGMNIKYNPYFRSSAQRAVAYKPNKR